MKTVKLLTKAQFEQLCASGVARMFGRNTDPFPIVKLFTPDAQCTWLLASISPDNHDAAFGLCDIGQGFPELGYVSLAKLGALRGHLGLGVERDTSFVADRPLSAYAAEARQEGRIIDYHPIPRSRPELNKDQDRGR